MSLEEYHLSIGHTTPPPRSQESGEGQVVLSSRVKDLDPQIPTVTSPNQVWTLNTFVLVALSRQKTMLIIEGRAFFRSPLVIPWSLSLQVILERKKLPFADSFDDPDNAKRSILCTTNAIFRLSGTNEKQRLTMYISKHEKVQIVTILEPEQQRHQGGWRLQRGRRGNAVQLSWQRHAQPLL